MTAPGTRPDQAAYRFRPLTAQDMPLVRTWQMTPHVQDRWDADPITLAAEDEPGTGGASF